MNFKKRILVAPLNWGLGHATRCIPIIQALIDYKFEPIIASDGVSLDLLKKEFPLITCIALPPYHIQYSKYGVLLKWQIAMNIPKILTAIKKERHQVQKIIKDYSIDGVISDNRFGVYSINKAIPSVYITHQINVFSGITTFITTKLHHRIIKKHDECWIPDYEQTPNLSGKLSHIKNSKLPLKYIGPLSRFKKTESKSKYHVMLLLSGPEPQRQILEEKLIHAFKSYKGNLILVRGKIEKQQTCLQKGNIIVYNFMNSHELEKTIQSSDVIVSRSGYTTIMDLAMLGKKAFFIPTPGQNEQYILAKTLEASQVAPYCKQDAFNLQEFEKIKDYKGFRGQQHKPNFEKLFALFERK
jgi:uncharacterized protein (TIGR00661 family)